MDKKEAKLFMTAFTGEDSQAKPMEKSRKNKQDRKLAKDKEKGAWAKVCYNQGSKRELRWVPLNDPKVFASLHGQLDSEEHCCLWEDPCYRMNWFSPEYALKGHKYLKKPDDSLITCQIFVDCDTPWDGRKR